VVARFQVAGNLRPEKKKDKLLGPRHHTLEKVASHKPQTKLHPF
jgi:hypothetical protein